ncbi:Putative colanic biosynthesis UDP-glucose lipid carrier transferase [uncultured Ruminococcus sp.]|nr:Putative colanic biosynthesis UDP-glucose lipid carrier transferase [uncultured Ruminococcus sp.]
MDNQHKPYGSYEKYFKRPIDIVCALLAIIVFSWLYIIIAIMVRVKLGSPVIFTQERPGKDEKIFKLYKFRTMTGERDENGELLPDEVRLTKFGAWLRRTSLDELPEAFNILVGNLSIIGPRPLLVKYLDLYSPEQHRRHEVRPGLSGYAQVHGRNAISWEEKFKLDVEYVDHITFLGDLKIIWDTVMVATVYKGNIIKNLIMGCQSYTKYRPNETTGGIFVSWRRKEELPTGA